MDIGLRAVNHYLSLKVLSPKEDMEATLGEGVPSDSVVKKCAAEFKHNGVSLEDDHPSGRPVTVITQEAINKFHYMILTDQHSGT